MTPQLQVVTVTKMNTIENIERIMKDDGRECTVKYMQGLSTPHKNEVLCWACRNGHAWIVEVLLGEAGVNPRESDDYCIKWAAANDHTSIVEMLLQNANSDEKMYEHAMNYVVYGAISKQITAFSKL